MKNYTTHFHHIRNAGRGKKDNYTLAMIATETTVFVGIAKCSRRDNFVKAKGRLIAGGRATKALHLATAPDAFPPDSFVDWSMTIDRKDYGLEGERIKREVVALALNEIHEKQVSASAPQYSLG